MRYFVLWEGEEINIKISADKLIYYQERNVAGISRRNES